MSDIGGFFGKYKDLENRMKLLAQSDGEVFLPNPTPPGEVEYIFVCMEPSLGRWAQSPDEAKVKVEAGFRNFLFSMEDFLLHYSIRRYLCQPGERYHLTDLLKGAMLTKRAAAQRRRRYDRWYGLLLEELDLVAKPDAQIFAVGNAADDQLRRRDFGGTITKILHYSGLAARSRARAVVGHEKDFAEFLGSVTLSSVLETAEEVLIDSDIPEGFRNETLARLSSGRLSESRQQLLFSYMPAFKSLGSTVEMA